MMSDKTNTEFQTEYGVCYFFSQEERRMIKTLMVQGMKGIESTGAVSDALNNVDGIEADVSMKHGGEAVVRLTKNISNDTLKSAVKDAGYNVTEIFE